MSEKRFTLSAAVYLLLEKDNKILLLRRSNTGWGDGQYTLAAGHLDGNEPLKHAALREAKEELGITIQPDDLEFVHVMHHMSDKEYIVFLFKASEWQGEPYNAEPEKCDDLQWFDADNLPDNTLPHVKDMIKSTKAERYYSEINW